jgi:dethiobiotin synthetase
MSYPDIRSLKAGSATGFFITGTDTDVGKTFIATRIAQQLRQQGHMVAPRKPIASGCIRQTNGTLLSEDALALQFGAQSSESLDTICPYQFEPALSPQTALEMAKQVVTTQDLVLACETPKNSFKLVEGAGGFLSPLCSNGLNRDLAVELQIPVIVVVANRLGCLNQALLTLEAIQNCGLTTHAIVINHVQYDSHNFAEDLHKWTDIPIFQQKNLITL